MRSQQYHKNRDSRSPNVVIQAFDENKENYHTSLDQVNATYDNRGGDNLIYSPTDETLRLHNLNNTNNQTQYLQRQLEELNKQNIQDQVFNVQPMEDLNLKNFQEQQQQNFQNNLHELDKSLSHLNFPLSQTQNMKYNYTDQTNFMMSKENLNFNQNQTPLQQFQLDDTNNLKSELETRYFQQSREFNKNSQIIPQFDDPQMLNMQHQQNSQINCQNIKDKSQSRIQSQPVTQRQTYIDCEEQQTQENSNVNNSKMYANQLKNQHKINDISQYNPVDQSSSIYEYTQDYGSKKHTQFQDLLSQPTSPQNFQQPTDIFSQKQQKQSLQQQQNFQNTQGLNSLSGFNDTRKSEAYLIRELEFLKQQLKDLEELHQTKIVENVQELQHKDKYIVKLEKQIRDMVRQQNEQILEFKNQLVQRDKSKEQNKTGLKSLIQIVNLNKQLIIEDIIQHVNIFESLTQKMKNQDEGGNQNVYELLRVILEALFDKVKNQKGQKEQKDGR
eukprot:403351098